MTIHAWAQRWNIPPECVEDLRKSLGLSVVTLNPTSALTVSASRLSEAWAQSAIRLEASKKGVLLFRNNVGALHDKESRPVRFGLGNDSAVINKVLKSGDLIGIRPVLIGPHHVGHTIGQFVSREVKRLGWTFTATEREAAQLNWLNLVNGAGGDAAFATDEGTL